MSSIFLIEINNIITLNARGGNFFLDPPVEGLALPKVRNSSFNWSGKDGGLSPESYFGMRFITLKGRVRGDTPTELAENRLALQNALASKIANLIITTDDGRRLSIDTKLLDFDCDIIRTKEIAPFRMDLLAPDPLIYDLSSLDGNSVTIERNSSGGYVTPYILPVVWEAGTQPTNVINNGSKIIYPIITFTGEGSNPELRNNTTGKYFGVDFNLSDGDEVVVDMLNRTILLNGGSVVSYKSSGSSWWGLEVGDNLCSLTTDAVDDTITAEVTWKTGYLGI